MSPDAAVEAPTFYRCPCGCGWVRDDLPHLAQYLAASGYGLDAIR